MSNFSNEKYKYMIEGIINDIYYSNCSLETKALLIRKYIEIVIRKILDKSENFKVTIGDRDILGELRRISLGNSLLMDSLENIKGFLNEITHSRKIEKISEEDFKKVEEEFSKIHSYLFVNFFEKYSVWEDNELMAAFSILPPKIRYIVLNNLYGKIENKNNAILIDKLSLAILKFYGLDEALKWLEEEKENLEKISSVSKEVSEIFKEIDMIEDKNMYIVCKEKILDVNDLLEKKGRLYETFEEAKELYEENGKLQEISESRKEFNSIMEFYFIGRKKENKDVLRRLTEYAIIL